MADNDPTRPTPNLESRVARLEATTESILRELLEMRADIRELRAEMRQMRADLETTFRWLLKLMIYGFVTLAGIMLVGFTGLLGVMAHGFHWF